MGDAVLSACRRYRYHLTREVSKTGRGRVLFVMLNPSTADATQDDPTIRKCLGFAQRKWNAYALDVVNLYAWRATDPDDLRLAAAQHDVVGPLNDAHIELVASRASVVVAAWGALNLGTMSKAARARAREVVDRVRLVAPVPQLVCLGRTNDGQPRHPLLLPYAVDPAPWTAEAHRG